MRPELLKGHLDTLLLAILEPGPQHGYAIIESLRSGSDGALDLPTGTVYPALHRLERAGLIASDWQTVGGRRRRAYHSSPPPSAPSLGAEHGRHRLATNTDMRLQGALATYLSDVAAQLRGPRRRRAAILAELRDGLDQPGRGEVCWSHTARLKNNV